MKRLLRFLKGLLGYCQVYDKRCWNRSEFDVTIHGDDQMLSKISICKECSDRFIEELSSDSAMEVHVTFEQTERIQ